jgi:hypothetical protein
LATAVNKITTTNADLIFTLAEEVFSDGRSELLWIAPTERYDPSLDVPASCWLLRRELIEEIGPWNFYQDIYMIPSQDFLFRAWKRKKNLLFIPHLTVVVIPSGNRKNVYANRDAEENKFFFHRIRSEPDFRIRELTAIVLNPQKYTLKWFPVPMLLEYAVKNIVRSLILFVGFHPGSFRHFVKYGRKGAFIDHLRWYRGLKKVKRDVPRKG